MTAKTLMVVGSMSSAGKSLLVTALCRIYARRGLRVAPFKAQNMSNNAAVCPDGAEIGRAQALQALAAGIPPAADMNPVLLKPEADARSQVLLMGRPWSTLPARDYYARKAFLWAHVTAALDRLRSAFDLVIIEGAGSPAEMNLKGSDIVNLAVARYAQAPVLLVGDIDRGGIFAQLLGTLWLLEAEERALVRGLVINKFRGDSSLFEDGVRILEQKGGVPVLGVVSYLPRLNLPDEDAVAIEEASPASGVDPGDPIDLAVLAFPRIANFDDFDPLQAEPGVRVRYVRTPEELGRPSAILLPGTKSTLADLEWLHQTGLAQPVIDFARSGGRVVGICGGYQMLGQRIEDPLHVESGQSRLAGLGLLPVHTQFLSEKATYQARAEVQDGPGWLGELKGMSLEGYEIHMGRTDVRAPWLLIRQRNGSPVHAPDGSCSPDGCVWGCYLHGLFANDEFRRAWLRSLGWRAGRGVAQAVALQQSIERLADAVEGALKMDEVDEIVWQG
jgi:adenosylcobyric acid synthase